ncbi:MAG: hypothetical protein JKY56_16070, partial [Kofleriaceae bacterium]|nr:hypothetical protein [Kofleriaceae bacterium]
MEKTKFAVLGFGVLGLLAVFLPFISFGDESFSMWKLREAVGSGQVFMIMGGFLAAAIMGGLALKDGMARWQGIVASLGFALTLVKLRPWGPAFSDGAIGAKLMILSAFIGIAVA